MIVPLHYSLSLDPLLEQQAFSGEVSIVVAVDGIADRVVLDSSGLTILEATIDGRPAAVEIDADRLSIVSAVPLAGPRATVRIAFRGQMNRSRRGFFMSGECAVTQLQPAYARRLFPCFDDPYYKTTFDLSVSAAGPHTVVSNAHVLRDETDGDRHRLTFTTSPKIPTHLLGLAVGPFRVSTLHHEGLPLRFLSLREDGRALLESVRDLVSFFEDRFGVPYPWPKLDLVAVPEFEAAGIETTSVLYFRESAVLLDSGAGSKRYRERDALLAHELAHQWFGSLVTPSSWEDLWISEGFATWASTRATPARDHDPDDADAVRAIRAAMLRDSLPASRPLRITGSSADELHELYDDLVYWKGAAILRMLEAWLGEETFARGVTLFLTRHAGGHATSADLWHALADVSAESVAAVASPFVERPGVPLLHFLTSGPAVRIEQRGDTTRSIPVVIKAGLSSGEIVAQRLLLTERATEVRFPDEVRWVFGNSDAAGYYRCSYDDLDSIPLSQLSGGEAVVLLSDVWDALWSGSEDVVAYLRAVDRMSGHAGIAELARVHLSDLTQLLATGIRQEPFAKWISDRFPATAPGPGSNVADAAARFEDLLTDPATRPSAWEHLKAHWDELRADAVTFGGRGAIAALATVSDRAMRDDIARFFAERGAAGAERTLRQTLAAIDGRIRFREREQLAVDAWLTRQMAPAVTADEALRQIYTFLTMLAAGFHGALVHRSWLEGLGLTPPGWMQPLRELAAVIGALDRRIVSVFAGAVSVDASLLNLSDRLREDLLASSDLSARLIEPAHQSAAETVKAQAAILARQAAFFERLIRGTLTFAELFGDDRDAGLLRRRLASTEDGRSRLRALLDRVASGSTSDDVQQALRSECASLPSLQKSQAADLGALAGAIAAMPPRPTERGS